MIKFVWDEGFKRAYRKKVRRNFALRKRFWRAISIFAKNPFSVSLRTHKLSGKLEGLWAFSVSYSCRVIFDFISPSEVLLIDIGGHDEVY